MITAPVRLQDLRRRIYVKAKADTSCGVHPGDLRASAGGDGVSMDGPKPYGCFAAIGLGTLCRKSLRRKIGPISFGVKQIRKPSAGNLHAGFDEAGTGNQLTVWLPRNFTH
jgi:hypothetical protein